MKLKNKKIDVLDKGSVEFIDRMGDDLRICEAARVSTGAEADKGPKANEKLIEYLYKNDHLTPFEQVTMTFKIKCPIFVARQWMRSRTQSYNEASARYKEFEWECYMPNEWRMQDTKNKQGSLDVKQKFYTYDINQAIDIAYNESKECYENALDQGVAREQARTVMPVGQYTEFFMTVNLRNLFHFLELRMHDHAQYEIQVYANTINSILSEIEELKFSWKIFDNMREVKYLVQEAVSKYKNLDLLKDYLGKFQ